MKRLIALMTALLCFALGAPPVHADAANLQPLVAADVGRVLAPEPGKAQIVEIWSLDCSYCRENVARIMQWQRNHRDVRVTMIAMDALDDNAEALAQALATMHLSPQVAQYANAEAIPEKLRRALDSTWHGELPRTVLIDASGTRQSHSGLLAPGVLDQWRGE
ncbi:TlpA family protein disulfide reductase [Paraburkholderia edwinii]|uniref:TlpA family protein disulfide reductase n=1 Tax=Paraburkholderia edwinii TaxID=2861782 RepID=A0ABX8ULS7_9BURK|nr:TlpA disulfide reductase family protein [Paraburkholderia edwinii]QYD69914.1 TlpA family protein disulfide reductase [Paraburkholderia edwinii]